MLFEDYYQKAPEKIQEWVDSFDSSDLLAQIAVNHKIDDKGLGNRELGRLTGQVLVGMVHPKDFVPSLVEKLGVPKEKAQEIAKEVNQKIFSPVKDLLIELHGLNKTQTINVEAQPYEIKVPQKPKAPEPKTGIKKNLFDGASEKLKIPPIPIPLPVKKSTPPITTPPLIKTATPSIPTPPPIPQAPQKNQSEVNLSSPVINNSSEVKVPTPPTPTVPQSHVTINKTPVPKKEMSLPEDSSQKLKNPFEEKLRQTLTFPPRDPSLKTPFKKDITAEEKEKEKKKEAVTKDPYLETPE